MKREEFFEALSDIDEKMVAAAKQNEEVSAPVIVTPKKSYVKPICTAAACVALAAAITAVAANLNRSSNLPIAPIAENNEYKTVVNVVNGSKYPEDMYRPSYDYSKLEMKYIGDEYPNYPNPSKFRSYDELAEYSQLVVMGTFTSDSGQVAQTYELPDFSQAMKGDYFNKYISFNSLKVEKVLKSNGKVWAGDEIIITQPYSVYTHSIDEYPPDDGKGALYSFSQLTPLIKGDKWIYFLTENSSGYPEIFGDQSYSAVNDYEGRYPVPDEENPLFEYRENVNGVVAPAVFNQGIYSELKEKLENAEQSKRPPYELKYEKVIGLAEALGYVNGYPTGLNVEFDMEEFEGITFGWQEGALYTRTNNSEERNTVIGGPGCYVVLGSTYLCDMNGDGKREICTEISLGSGIINNLIWVLDHANDKKYFLSARGEYDYFLQKRNGELEYLKTQPVWSSNPNNETGTLTLDIMTEYVPDDDPTAEPEPSSENVIKIMDLTDGYSSYLIDMPLIFGIEEFPDISFERDPTKDDRLYLKEGEKSRSLFSCDRINSIYLCDLNGDGNREICAAIDVSAWDYRTGSNVICPSIAVIDYANNNSYLLFTQEKNEERNCDYTLKAMNDILFLERIDPQTGTAMSSEPLTLDIFEREGRVMNDDIEIIIIMDE